MVETSGSIPTEQPIDYRQEYAQRVLAELGDIREWYESHLSELGEMQVSDADLTDGKSWKAAMTEEDQVREIDGSFFVLRGQHVQRLHPDGTAAFSWTQPGVLQKETIIQLPTPEGPREIAISGMVGIIMDQEDNLLLTLSQEPFANTPKRALFKTPFQTSAAKLQGLIDGKKELDPNLFQLLQSVGEGQSVYDMFASGKAETFPLPYADANRISATNLGFVLRVTSPDLAQQLTNNNQNIWVKPNSVNKLAKAGLLNGHTATALAGARAK